MLCGVRTAFILKCVRAHATKCGCAKSRFAARGLPCPLGRCRRAPPRAYMLQVHAQVPLPSTLGSRSKRENISSELEATFSFRRTSHPFVQVCREKL